MNTTNIKFIEEKASAAYFVLELMPHTIKCEIERICRFRKDFPEGLGEIRVKSGGRSSISIFSENIPLFSEIDAEEINELFDRITGGSLYAHAKDMREGFVSLDKGIRVGISGVMGERGGIPKNITGLVFRIPTGKCSFEEKLADIFKSEGTNGMLIYSLPGAGKTTALRALAGRISRDLCKKVIVIDERREFIGSEYKDAMVDILCGYSKPHGLEIALRTLGAEVIIVDEIGSAEEGESLLKVGRGGVPVIATAHAGSYDELKRKEGIAPLIREGYFNRFVRLYREEGKFYFEADCG